MSLKERSDWMATGADMEVKRKGKRTSNDQSNASGGREPSVLETGGKKKKRKPDDLVDGGSNSIFNKVVEAKDCTLVGGSSLKGKDRESKNKMEMKSESKDGTRVQKGRKSTVSECGGVLNDLQASEKIYGELGDRKLHSRDISQFKQREEGNEAYMDKKKQNGDNMDKEKSTVRRISKWDLLANYEKRQNIIIESEASKGKEKSGNTKVVTEKKKKKKKSKGHERKSMEDGEAVEKGEFIKEREEKEKEKKKKGGIGGTHNNPELLSDGDVHLTEDMKFDVGNFHEDHFDQKFVEKVVSRREGMEEEKKKKKKKKKGDQGAASKERELLNDGVVHSICLEENIDSCDTPKKHIGGEVKEKVDCLVVRMEKKKKKKKMKGDQEAAHEEAELVRNDNMHLIGHRESREGSGNKRKKAKLIKHDERRTVDGGGAETSKPSESPTSERKSKKVRFSGNVEVFPFADSSSGGEKDPEQGVVRGKRFSKEEDEMVRMAVLNYIEVHSLGEEGLKMVLNCRSHPEVKNCWKEIGKALPWRPPDSVYYRAHILFQRGDSRKWTPEELEMVKQFHKQHGAEWKTLAEELGKHRFHVKDAWRRIRLPNMRKGKWSQEEYQTLFDLVNMDLQMKASMERKSKHGMLRDNISWEAISEKLSTRTNSVCCMKWYGQLTSPMVAEGNWADADDYRLLIELLNLDASCEEDVIWENLLEHRSGDICRKRWNQMVRHIGEHSVKSFPEQVEILSQRYCPDLLEAREAYASRPEVD
ncbi:hypothetical protein Ancab_015106 [Ancistrocladus abbreviatus]